MLLLLLLRLSRESVFEAGRQLSAPSGQLLSMGSHLGAALEAPPGGGQLAQAIEPAALVMPARDAETAPSMDRPSTSGSSSSSSPLVRTVNPGDRVNIPCSLSNAGGSIQFAKDDQPIILDSGCAQCQLDISNDGQASLTINRVAAKDQGHWQCWRLDAAGKVKQRIPIIQLVVTNSPELPILIVNDKELLLGGGNNLDATITVKENELVSFRCVIKGATTPVDYVHWMLDSSQNVTDQSQLMLEYSQQENNYLTQSVLRLNATKSMNLKSISCLSNHQLWLTPMTVTAFLNVLYEPSFTISREPGFGMPVSEGMTVILKCEIDSNPSSSPVWIKDADNKTASAAAAAAAASSGQQQLTSGKEASGEPILLDTQDDGSLVFAPAQRSDSGWYRCKTENKYGNFSSFGYFLNVRPSSSQQQANANNNIQQLASSAGRNFGAGGAGSGSRLMAPNQAAARLGQSSAASNIMNNDQPSIVSSHQHHHQAPASSQAAHFQPFTAQQQQLEKPRAAPAAAAAGCPKDNAPRPPTDGFPVIDHPVSVVRAKLGRQLILPLRFCCQPGPSRVFWIHRHLAMIPGRMFGPYITREVYPSMNSFYCYESTFEIEAVKPEDIGTVYVFVSNDKGHAGAQIHIQLASPEAERAPATADGFGATLGEYLFRRSSSGDAKSKPTTGQERLNYLGQRSKLTRPSRSVHFDLCRLSIPPIRLRGEQHSAGPRPHAAKPRSLDANYSVVTVRLRAPHRRRPTQAAGNNSSNTDRNDQQVAQSPRSSSRSEAIRRAAPRRDNRSGERAI